MAIAVNCLVIESEVEDRVGGNRTLRVLDSPSRNDNHATAVAEHDGNLVRFHPRFLAFAREYSFLLWACHVRAAWEKGKIERVIGYARTSFGPLRTFTDLAFNTDCEPVCDWKDRVIGRFPDTFELY